MAAETLIQ